MVSVTITPRSGENLYRLLIEEERELRRNGQGTLHRHGPRRRGSEKWIHRTISGYIKFQPTLGDALVAVVASPKEADEWRLLNSFIGFVHRHFRDEVASILLTYAPES